VQPDTAHLAPLLVPLLILVILVRRSLRERRVKVERLWLAPVLLVMVAGTTLYAAPPKSLMGGLVVALGLGVGAAMGWWRGRLTNVSVNPETHELTSRTSPIGVLLVAGLFVLRYALRYGAESRSIEIPGGATLLTDALLLFAVGTVSAQRLEIWLRCQRLLTAARASKA
jgi:hypothetical protein